MILTYQSVLCHHVFSDPAPVFSVSSSSLPAFFCFVFVFVLFLFLFCFCLFLFVCLFLFFVFAFFSPPSFRVFYNLLTVLRGCFNRRNTSSLLLSYFFPFSPLFFLLFSLSFLSSLPFLSLSLQIFGAANAAMPHRFRRACLLVTF